MKKKFPLSYRTIQKIKAEEYERFFSELPGYYVYMNHLGEVRWMTEEEAADQHEFFLYSESVLKRWERRLRLGRKYDLGKMTDAEREVRLHIRRHLEKKFSGEVDPETAAQLPSEWKYDINGEELANIPVSIDVGNEGIWKKLFITIGFLAAIAIVSYFWVGMQNKPLVGKLMVHCDIRGARIYMDETNFVGYSNKLIVNVPAGVHRITAFKEGYIPIPGYHEVDIRPDSLTTLEFKFNLSRSQAQGFLKIVAQQKNSKVYVDNDFYGTLEDDPVVTLEEGQHTINVKKEGFVTVPAEKIIQISAGDTSIFMVQQVPVPNQSRPIADAREGEGSIAVTSDVKKARIFLNGKDTGQETDYVFTQLPLGTYQIEVRREGFSVEPATRDVVLSRNSWSGNADFRLERTFERAKITTTPSSGTIYIDGKFVGEGKYEGVLKIGKHRLTFGEISGYNKPPDQDIDLTPGSPVSVAVNYFPNLKIVAGVDRDGNVYSENCDVVTGYTFSNRAFTASDEGGPSVEYNDKLKDYVWKLGYAFPYRNPKGNDAIKVIFKLPNPLDYGQTFKVRMLAASSREKYPLSLVPKIDISIKLDNNKLSYYYEPKFMEDLGGLEFVEWDITSYVHPGPNSFEVGTTDKNNTFYFIKSIEIFN